MLRGEAGQKLLGLLGEDAKMAIEQRRGAENYVIGEGKAAADLFNRPLLHRDTTGAIFRGIAVFRAFHKNVRA